ncbi:MAG: sulfatase [Flavobacteriaceae bacterium]|nr:sulfatase [Flavobacteriaceae bacterium]MCY4266926.1 sulfatase [Flavobacteriaceae bacterium]MCY4297866.1 sulfatase [Flavobacteriaceae bacterium]
MMIPFTIQLLIIGLFSLFHKEKQNIETEKPNIIIIFTDDQGYADLSSYGATEYQTPNIDELANNGIRFTNFYVPATVCTPSRAALLTGRYPIRANLHEAVLFPFSKTGLLPEEYTMAEMLKDVGYQTACIGKWHLGHLPEFLPTKQGFDYYFGVPYSNDMDSHYYKSKDFQSPPLPLYENETQIESGPDQRYLTKRLTDSAIDFIQKRDKSTPFFLYLAHVMPHIPLFASEDFKGKTDYGIYGDVISEIDWNVGRITSYLKEEGLFHNTLIIYTSDNGPHKAKDKGSAKPLRGWKAQTWEGGQRVPGIISWPKKIPKKTVISELVSTLDLMPTLAGFTEASLPVNKPTDGRNIDALLLNPSIKLEEFPFYYFSRRGQLEAVRLGKWKLHVAKSLGWDHQSGNFPISLYDLESDIGERNNLASQYPEIVLNLKHFIDTFE